MLTVCRLSAILAVTNQCYVQMVPLGKTISSRKAGSSFGHTAYVVAGVPTAGGVAAGWVAARLAAA